MIVFRVVIVVKFCNHDSEDGFSGQHYFPDGMERPKYYSPVERGFERELNKRLSYFKKLRTKRDS